MLGPRTGPALTAACWVVAVLAATGPTEGTSLLFTAPDQMCVSLAVAVAALALALSRTSSDTRVGRRLTAADYRSLWGIS